MKKITLFLLMMQLPVANAQQPLMRLFFSPAVRAAMDLRQAEKEAAKNKAGAEQAQTVTRKIEARGYVKQDGKKPVVWINDNNTLKSQKVAPDVRVRSVHPSGEIRLSVQGQGQIKLKPGQVISRNQRGAIDVYEEKK